MHLYRSFEHVFDKIPYLTSKIEKLRLLFYKLGEKIGFKVYFIFFRWDDCAFCVKRFIKNPSMKAWKKIKKIGYNKKERYFKKLGW